MDVCAYYRTASSATTFICDLSVKAISEIPKAEQVTHFVLKFFGVLRQGAVALLGVNDAVVQGFYHRRKLKRAPFPHSLSTTRRVNENYKYTLRGILQVASGTLGVTVAYHQLKHEHLSKAFHVVNKISNGLFIGAHLISFQQNYSLLKKSLNTLRHSTQEDQIAQARNERRSAFIGMLSSFCYIVSAVFGAFEVWLAAAIIFGCIAPATSVIQVLFEIYFQVGDYAPIN
jgi:hypothetical protein